MKISIFRRGESNSAYEGGISPGALVVSHGENLIPWSASPFDRTELQNNSRIFDTINGYWARLPMEKQNEIFALYGKVKFLMDHVANIDTMAFELMPVIADLIDNYHDIDTVRYWVDNYGNYSIPDNVQEATTFERGSPTTEEKTYVREEYRQLVAMATVLHAMVPIWGEFIFRTHDDTGTTFKEYYAYFLLGRSKILESAPMKKLVTYIEHQLPPGGSGDAAVLKGISKEDYPTWVLARALVRRVSICDIGVSIVKVVYQYIRQKNSGQKSGNSKSGGFSMSDIIRPKFTDSGNSDDENNHSVLEGYMIQTEVSTGDIGNIKHYLFDSYLVARKIDPTISPELVMKCFESCQQLLTTKIHPVQITMTAWILKDVISPRSYEHIKKHSVVSAISIATAVLLHRRQTIMAGFVSAIAVENDGGFRLTGSESKAKLSKEIVERLDALYPLKRRINSKKSTRPANQAVLDIDTVVKALGENEWKITLPDQWLLEYDPPLISRFCTTPFEIRNLVGQMVLGIFTGENQ